MIKQSAYLLRLPEKEMNRAKKEAQKRGITFKQYIRNLIDNAKGN